jgi:hypothetical protein
LFSIDDRIPKLNVAGSIPVSRSKNLQIPIFPSNGKLLFKHLALLMGLAHRNAIRPGKTHPGSLGFVLQFQQLLFDI